MVDYEQVLERFITLTGMDEDTAIKWQWLCNDAIISIANRLKSNVNADESCGRLSAAAAALAFYNYTVLKGDDKISSFKAGDVTIGFSNSLSVDGLTLWQQAERSVADLLTDDSFIFKRVK